MCQLLAEGKARIADLADEIVLAGDEFYHLFLAQSDFPQSILNFRGGAELLDANGDAGLHAAKRARFATDFAGRYLRIVAHGVYNGGRRQCATNPDLRFAVPELQSKVSSQSRDGTDYRVER